MIHNFSAFRRKATRKLIPFSLIVFAAVFQTAAANDKFSNLFVFGDSLSDPGNALVLSGGMTSSTPFEPIPVQPYSSGRYSNSRVWIERLARKFHLRKGGKAALRKPGKFTNYAVGDALAGGTRAFDLPGQVSLFQSDFGYAPSDGLYVLWLGANDILAALIDPSNADEIITTGVLAEADSIASLYSTGARNFLILNSFNLGVSPAVTNQGPDAIAGATFTSEAYNVGLSDALDGIERMLPDINIMRFDAFGLLADVVSDPHAFGLTNVQTPCLTFFVEEDAVCEKPGKHLFWDAVHPTKKAHKILAKAVKEFLDNDSD